MLEPESRPATDDPTPATAPNPFGAPRTGTGAFAQSPAAPPSAPFSPPIDNGFAGAPPVPPTGPDASFRSDAFVPTASPEVPSSPYPFRLLADERVLASYPIATAQRPLGRLASYLFVTDSRVVYAAESKTICSSSTDLKAYKLDTVDGLETGRHRGLPAIGVGILCAIVLNVVLMVIGGVLLNTLLRDLDGASGFLATVIVLITLGTFAMAACVILLLRRPTSYLNIVGPKDSKHLARQQDLVMVAVTTIVLLLFGPLLGPALLLWIGARELGVFTAADAQLYADSRRIDTIAFDAGAVITDAQARGTLAGS